MRCGNPSASNGSDAGSDVRISADCCLPGQREVSVDVFIALDRKALRRNVTEGGSP